MTRPGRLWRIAVIGLLISLPVQAHRERDEDSPVSVRADASDPQGTVFPSDLFTVHDYGQLTRRRVALPKPDCTTNPNDCFYEDSFVKPFLIAASMGGTSWAPHEGMWGAWHGTTSMRTRLSSRF